ncbi:protein Mnn4p [Monosporozyma servazzii]
MRSSLVNSLARTVPNAFRRVSRSHLKKLLYIVILTQVFLFTVFWSASKQRTSPRPLTQEEQAEFEHQAELNPHLIDPDYDYFRNSQNHASVQDDALETQEQLQEEYQEQQESSRPTLGSFSDYLSGWYSSSTPIKDLTLDTISKLYEKLKYNTKPFWFDDYTLQNNLLTISLGSKRGQQWSSIDEVEFYDSDPRLTWTVFIDHILRNAPVESNANVHDWQLPFSWYDWVDMHELNKLVALNEFRPTCDFLFEGSFQRDSLTTVENELGETLFTNGRYKYDNEKWYTFARQYGDNGVLGKLDEHCEYLSEKPKFSTGLVVKKRSDRCRIEVYQLQLRNYLYSSIEAPVSLSVTASNGKTYQFYFKQTGDKQNMIQSNMLQSFVENKLGEEYSNDNNARRNLLDMEDITFNHFEMFGEFIKQNGISDKFVVDIKETNHDLMNVEELILDEADFEFDPIAKIKELEVIPAEEMTPHIKNYLNSLKTSITYNEALCPKYFQESSNVQEYRGLGFHRDARFFNGDSYLFDKQEYINRLNSMIRTFQKFTLSNGIISWLSHGTLYGYMYNGEAFPWDEDFDLQLPVKHLNYLAQYFNQSIIFEDPREGNGKYLVDVSSSITVRTNGNGKNNIDARFIDLDSGLYIDLTGLSVSTAVANNKVKDYMEEQAKALNISFTEPSTDYPDDKVPDDSDHIGFMNIFQLHEYKKNNANAFNDNEKKDIDKLYKKETDHSRDSKSLERKMNPAQRYMTHKLMKMYNCRNNHMSPMSYLSPMYNSVFHGVPALVPKRYVRSLRNEYGVPELYGYITYKEYSFVPGLMHWVKTDFVEKCSNLQNWFRDTVKLPKSTSLKELEFSDLQTFISNFPAIEVDDMITFSKLYNSFDQFAYRMKEIAIEFDTNLTQDQKEKLLNILRVECSKKVRSPGKDAHLYAYEKRLYEKLVKEFDPLMVKKAREAVDTKYLKRYWEQLSALKNHELPLFQTSFEIDLDFMATNKNTTSKCIDMNLQGRSDIYPDNSKDCLKLFNKDPMI